MPRPVRLTAPGVALIAVCYGVARFAYGLFVPAFRAELGLSDTLLGVIAAGSYVGYCGATVVAAAAVPRIGSRAVAGAAGAVAAVGMALIAAADHPAVLAAAVLVAGSSTGLASPPLAQVLARWMPLSAHDRAQAVVNAGPGVGIALSAPVALLALDQWRAAWLVFALVAGVVTVWVLLALPPDGRAGAGETATGGPGAGNPVAGSLGVGNPGAGDPVAGKARLLDVATGAGAPRLVVGAALFGASSACTWTFARDHVTSAGGLAPAASTLLWVTLGVAGLAGAVAGDLIARHGLRAVWRASMLALATATITFAVAPGGLTAAFVAMAVFGAAYMILTFVVFTWGLRLHPEHPAAAIGLGFLMIAAGQAVGAPIAGVVADRGGLTAAFCVFAAFGVLTALLAAPRPTLVAGEPGAPLGSVERVRQRGAFGGRRG